MQGSQQQRNERSSMSDPDMYYNYTPTSAAAESGKLHLGAVSRAAFPQSVHVPEGDICDTSDTHLCLRLLHHTCILCCH